MGWLEVAVVELSHSDLMLRLASFLRDGSRTKYLTIVMGQTGLELGKVKLPHTVSAWGPIRLSPGKISDGVSSLCSLNLV
jgi:hypothetical protein